LDHPQFNGFRNAKAKGVDFYAISLTFDEKNKFFDHVFKYSPAIPKEFKDALYNAPGYVSSHVFLNNLVLYILNYTDIPFSDSENAILIRFGKAFEQAYIRFLDLQKAEAQAHEAQIEAALEKVRSRSLAMHSGNELGDVVKVIVEKLLELNVVLDANGVVLCTYFEDSKDVLHWISSPDFSFTGSYLLPYFDHVIFNDAWNSKVSGEAYFSKSYSVEEKNSFWEYAFEYSDYRNFPADFKQWVFQNNKHSLSFAWQKNSAILIPSHTGIVPSEIDINVLKRFAKVFEQAYVRFMDLQKVEAQAREAQIEAALERVRSRSLAMHQSIELQEVISVVFQQMQKLGIKADASLINILTEDSRDFYLWIGTVGQTYAQKIRIPYIKHPVFDVFYEARDQGKTFMTNSLSREEKDSFFEYAFEHSDLRLMPDERKKYVMNSAGFARSFAWSVNSGITIQNYAGIPYSDQENEILKRFARVFEQAYTRFLDVKNAEKQALEAIKQASLDRVRGEIASMRSTDDLNRITPLIWHELNALEVPFIRCGVLIMFNETEIVQTHLSAPDGTAMGIFELPFDSEYLAKNTVKHWKDKTIYKEHWTKNQFLGFMDHLLKLGKIKNTNSYTGSVAPPETLYLNFVPFKQGMLYVGNTNPLSEDALDLVKSLAKTFSIAYARYEDFKNIEEAKNKIEQTLNDLKAAQTQLIHAEKMASLGELTAGIAHEIQNPLNFVNNFSEVNSELVEELKTEKAKGKSERDEELEEEILNDIQQNTEKIIHHGRRAEAIVKGMLQHSRTSTGQKELIDINSLADEYLRLAYHGLRAKDKSFNSDFKTEFDESLPKINVIPQDVGRVLLNLINNAFYAVKAPLPPPDGGGFKDPNYIHKPMVIVKTSFIPPSADGGMRGAVKISVKDNGPGIPQNIIDKIFQPFFTTKPTGQGTGLGLSLSYDIVKAHGGSITVDSKEGQGTEFIIQLPVN
jgi:signal transduction histidine kinase